MKEITFLKQNHEKWQQFETLLDSRQQSDPDALADLFIRITDDLSWARTFYPGSNTEKYLNTLAARVHQEIYKNKKERRSRILTFWSDELPRIMAAERMNLLIVFAIFLVSVWIGVISAKHDEGFVRIIMGDNYVDKTIKHIKEGDPLGVYKSDNQFAMFFGIALNNARVAILCVLAGLLGWIGVSVLQFQNGVMLGAFLEFLAKNKQLHEAMLTVWIHGVIEISCIIVAGAAGIRFASGFWFPGAWPRGVAFRRSARDGLKIAFGLIPFFFLAAFFEGFITRYTEMPDVLRLLIIYGSVIFIAWYFILYPQFVKKLAGGEFFTLDRVPLAGRFFRGTKYEGKTFNHRIAFLLMIGTIMIVLPVFAMVMQVVVHKAADPAAYLFYSISITGGGFCIRMALGSVGLREENDLTIDRKTRQKTAEYERNAGTVKI
ncbi:MAG TPA: stage II sporulation protein M [Bacteroidia bacterium]|nr:stage II sporulation protein M [Bacteroidia bacterium]